MFQRRLDEHFAHDTRKTSGVERRCEQCTGDNKENIAGRPLAEMTAGIEKNTFVSSLLTRPVERDEIFRIRGGFQARQRTSIVTQPRQGDGA